MKQGITAKSGDIHKFIFNALKQVTSSKKSLKLTISYFFDTYPPHVGLTPIQTPRILRPQNTQTPRTLRPPVSLRPSEQLDPRTVRPPEQLDPRTLRPSEHLDPRTLRPPDQLDPRTLRPPGFRPPWILCFYGSIMMIMHGGSGQMGRW